MQPTRSLGLLAAAALFAAAGCSSNNNNGNDASTSTPDGGMVVMLPDGGSKVVGPDGAVQPGGGSCATPIDLNAVGTVMGDTITWDGSTTGMANELHPYGGCVEMDGPEVVFRYRVPAGMNAIKVSTAGSSFDTVVYVRENCSQAMGGMDIACNNDSYDSAPQSTLYLTNLIEGNVVFIVVDGNAGMGAMGGSDGMVHLTLQSVPFGTMGNPCRPMMEGSTTPLCDGTLRCSEGGGADGTALCVPTVAINTQCDQRGYTNTCPDGARCVTDPSPPDGEMTMAMCAMPGTRAGAACRMSEPRCDAPLACGQGDNPVCVRQLAAGQACDPTGMSNTCQAPAMCRALGDGGPAICAQ